MWISFLGPFILLVAGITISGIAGAMSTECPIMFGDSVVFVPSILGVESIQEEPSGFCKTMNFIGITLAGKISLIGGILLIPGLIAGVILFFMSKRPKSEQAEQNQQ